MTKRIWYLGAADPEMAAIERLLVAAGEDVRHALDGSGRRVTPATAYHAAVPDIGGEGIRGDADGVYAVECSGEWLAGATRIDHHRPGDPGWGVPPAEYLRGSSIGQVLSVLARSTAVTAEMLLIAAADHCLAAAYRGECPGVDPADLLEWRAATRAAFQRRAVADVLADVERATDALRRAPRITLDGGSASHCRTCGQPLYGADADGYDTRICGCAAPALPPVVADMRPTRGVRCAAHWRDDSTCGGVRPDCWADVPELPEAAARMGIAFLGQPRPPSPLPADWRAKIVLMAAGAEALAAWPDWARREGLVDLYGGDPARGFAGGYYVAEKPCGCRACGCTAHATTTDGGGTPVCAECAEYYVADDGGVICGRMMGGGTECPRCSAEIEWDAILTGDPGSGRPNYRLGSCGCEGREWISEDRGGWTTPRPTEEPR